ncbi:hypothetical protein PILCRDRAFT_91391 [Piloderma croceum F 1598]|uniref:Uncharacterized protein n=1 Tax=Piloderma croceum (strain F 1598) TaxID=765440 RepID=A0A0C3ASK7_PILCF|nr:hypothetical protein PILCRDRAFT_91391 [Piloderma croceum F 1598]
MTSLAAVYPYILAYKISNGIEHRHLADFKDAATRDNFGKYILEKLGGTKAADDDWYKLPDLNKFYAANTEARKHGHVYDLPDHDLGIPPHAVHFHILAFKVGNGETYRQLSDFVSVEKRTDFVNYLKALKAPKEGDWYKLPGKKEIDDAIAEALKLGGDVYDLPYAPHVRDLPSLDSESEALE